MDQKNLERITEDTQIWTSNPDIVLPIDGSDIPNFREWVNWSGWKGYSPHHTAYDFAAYLSEDGKVVLGLPKETPVRAIADGVVRQISNGLAGRGVPYACFMNIEHGRNGSGLFTAYHHIDPVVEDGQEVKKGDVVATLYKDAGNEKGKLVHLHFEMRHGWNIKDRKCNPESVFPLIAQYRATPQGNPDFRVSGLQEQPEIYIANFKKLLVNGY